MIYKFLLLSDEVETFSREICIDSEATFLELNDAILNSVNYTKDQITSFFICEDDREKREERRGGERVGKGGERREKGREQKKKGYYR